MLTQLALITVDVSQSLMLEATNMDRKSTQRVMLCVAGKSASTHCEEEVLVLASKLRLIASLLLLHSQNVLLLPILLVHHTK